MVERRTLEDVLEDLKQAEKEYKEKCLKYGITEKIKRKKKDDPNAVESEEEVTQEGEESVEQEGAIQADVTNEPIIEEKEEEISEN